MPNRKTHSQIGALSGLAITLYRSDGQRNEDRILEMIGGAIGGYLGSRIPDVLNPPTWPGHRKFAHSFTSGTISLAGAKIYLSDWENLFRVSADRIRSEKENEGVSNFKYFLLSLLEILARIVAGIGPGVVAGYISHLALDCSTTKRLPVI